MNYFITNKLHNVNNDDSLTNLDCVRGFELVSKAILENKQLKFINIDVETTGLDAYVDDLLLLTLYVEDAGFSFDMTDKGVSDKVKGFLDYIKSDYTFVGHNIKFDYQFIVVKLNVELEYLWDTMIASQKLMQGYNMQWRLTSVVQSVLNIIPIELEEKDEIRGQFIGMTVKEANFTNKQVNYAIADVKILTPLRLKLTQYINDYGMQLLIYDIHFPLIRVISEIELRGLVLNVEKVKEVVELNLTLLFELQCKLDVEFRRLRDTLLSEDDAIYLKGGKFSKERKQVADIIQTDLFSEVGKTVEIDTDVGCINWSSPTQVLYIIGRLKQPIPTKQNKYVVPTFDSKNKIIKNFDFTTEEKAFNEYLIEMQGSPIAPLIALLMEYRECAGELAKYGLSLIEKINPVTGRLHTKLKQAGSENGRFRSGGGKLEPDKINSQNFPKKKVFREIISGEEGTKILTIDLAGAEVTVMAAKANDTKIFDLTLKGDIHAHMATKAWRNIFFDRARRLAGTNDKLSQEFLEKSKTFVISREVNSSMRDSCKNNTFAVVYRVEAKRAGKTINVSEAEGQIYINTVKAEIPLTIRMIERNVERAVGKFDKYGSQTVWGDGYLILNERTKSRKWFPEVLEYRKKGLAMPYRVRKTAENQASNIPISGTQADMIQEAMVKIWRWIKTNNIKAWCLLQVHDELVYEFKDIDEDVFASNIKKILCDTCNLYLTDKIKMGAEYKIGPTWTK